MKTSLSMAPATACRFTNEDIMGVVRAGAATGLSYYYVGS